MASEWQTAAQFIAALTVTVLVYAYQTQRKSDINAMRSAIKDLDQKFRSDLDVLDSDARRQEHQIDALHQRASDYNDEIQKKLGDLELRFLPRKEADLLVQDSKRDRSQLWREVSMLSSRQQDVLVRLAAIDVRQQGRRGQ